MRAIVYIDGFNLYYGALKGTKSKWLDLEKYFKLLRANDEIQRICYFTAPAVGKDTRERQKTYLQALQTLPLVEVIEGKFKKTHRQCKVKSCNQPTSDRRYQSWEEKMTDVNIATRMVDDAYQDEADIFILVSGDSDLIPPLALINQRFPRKKLVVYIPGRSRARFGMDFTLYAKKRALPQNLLERSQLAPKICQPGISGAMIAKPRMW